MWFRKNHMTHTEAVLRAAMEKTPREHGAQAGHCGDGPLGPAPWHEGELWTDKHSELKRGVLLLFYSP